MKITAFIVLLLVAYLFFFNSPPQLLPANQGAAKVQVEIKPGSLKVTPNRTYVFSAAVRNISSYRLSNLSLTTPAYEGLSIGIDPPLKKILLPGSASVWSITLKKSEEAVLQDKLWFRLSFFYNETNSKTDTQGVVFTSIQLTDQPLKTIDELITITTEKTNQPLLEHQPGVFYLFIKNKSPVPVQVINVTSTLPPKITAHGIDTLDGKTLAPHQQRVLPVELRAERGVRPGEHLVVCNVAFQWQDANSPGNTHRENLVTTIKVKTKILGESEVLTVLGVPSFLLLPGFLMMITLGLLWKYVAPKKDFIKVKSPEFWFLAISMSIIVGLLYPVFTGRNYLKGYGLEDIVVLWSLSVGITVSIYFMIYLVYNGIKSMIIARNTISKHDHPLKALFKLHRNGLGILLHKGAVTSQQINQAFLLGKDAEKGKKAWIAPAIVLNWLNRENRELRKQVGLLLEPRKDLAKLLTLLKKGEKDKQLELKWDPASKLKGPVQIDGNELQFNVLQTIIREE